MSVRKAVYAASLDPITNGHANIIERASRLYDEVVVLVAVDRKKSYMFSPAERVAMAKDAVRHLASNVTVESCIGQYVVKRAESLGANVIVRGLRDFKDMTDEQVLADENRKICPAIETVWLPCLPDLMTVSSSMVKGHMDSDPGWARQVARSVSPGVVRKLQEKQAIVAARSHWDTLMSSLGNPEHGDEVFATIVGLYGEDQRWYHTLTHIVSMLDVLVQMGAIDPAVAFAIWFHDINYYPRSKNNEELSGEIARYNVHLLGFPDLAETVVDLVLATKHTSAPESGQAKVLIDLDLMVLGFSEEAFDDYEAAIRKEYHWVDDSAFAEGRSAILREFLSRESIYSTPFMHERYEEQARKNIRRSLERLGA